MSFIRKAMKGSAYVAVGNFGSQFLAILCQLIMIRLLSPEIYGQYATIMVIVEIAYTIAVVEFATACVYDIENEEVFHSAALMSISWTIGLAIVFSLVGLFIDPLMDPSLWNIALVLIVSKTFYGVGAVYGTYVERNFQFAGLTLIRLSGKALGLGLGLLMAYKGYGIYSLLCVDAVNYLLTALITIYYSPLKVRWTLFNTSTAKQILRQGFKQFQFRFSGVILYRSPIMVAQFLTGNAQIVGYVDRAMYLAQILNTFATAFTSKIAFLLFRKIGNEPKDLSSVLEKMIWLCSRLFLPVSAIYMFHSEFLLRHLYGAEWMAAAPYLRGLAIFSFLLVNYNLINQLYMAINRIHVVTYVQWASVGFYVAGGWIVNSLGYGFDALSWLWSILFIFATFTLLLGRFHSLDLTRSSRNLRSTILILVLSEVFLSLLPARGFMTYLSLYLGLLAGIIYCDGTLNRDYVMLIFSRAKQIFSPRAT